MLERHFGSRPVSSFVGKKLCDEVFGLVGHVLALNGIKVEFAGAYFLHDFLVAIPVEGRDTGQQHVGNYTGGPDIAFRVVILHQYFWSDVIGCSKLFFKLFRWVVGN